MSLHLAEVAQAVAPGAHGVMLMDRAGWHRTKDLVVPDNLTLVLLQEKERENRTKLLNEAQGYYTPDLGWL